VWQFGADFAAKHIMNEMNIDERLESLAKSIEASNLRSVEIDARLEAGFEKTQRKIDARFAKTQRKIDALLAVQPEHNDDMATLTANVDKLAKIWQETAQVIAGLAL
jgi:septation ring formation regulator EzrA